MSKPAPSTSHRNLAIKPDAILPRHLDRLAMVYVRQSSLHQVHQHQESTKIQYGLVDAASSMGWSQERIEVIDDDLGVSGASADGRAGFQRLLSEIALDHVGIVLGAEISRLARSCKDWYQLLELCAIRGTLIWDQDGLYDPTRYNDRLLLGLKGTISEAELHILKQRMLQGRLQKACRGELGKFLPVGYVSHPSGEIILDPDEQARSIVKLIFDQFERGGSTGAVLRYLIDHNIQLPVRIMRGPSKGELEWRRPSKARITDMYKNPIYAGAYVYGRRQRSRSTAALERGTLAKTSRLVSSSEWHVCIKDALPAYISWEQYENNVAQLAHNRSITESRGIARKGQALLSGLVVCGRCGLRMTTIYMGSNAVIRYSCQTAHSTWGERFCQGLAGRVLDAEVSRLVLRALEPSALEVSMQVVADIEKKREGEEERWQQRIERAEYESSLAERQYRATEPENRLVIRTLEHNWEEKLRQLETLQDDYRRFKQQQPQFLTEAEKEVIRSLADDLPSIWNAPTTTDKERKSIVREIVDKVVVRVEGDTEWVEVMIHWVGGHETYSRIRRPVRRWEQLSNYDVLVARVRMLRSNQVKLSDIADVLNEEGFYPTKRAVRFTPSCVQHLLEKLGLTADHNARDDSLLGPNDWWLPDLAKELKLPHSALRFWANKQWVVARRASGASRRWIITADAAERKRMQNMYDGGPRGRIRNHRNQAHNS